MSVFPCMLGFLAFFFFSSIRDRSLLIVGVGPKRKWLGQEKMPGDYGWVKKKLNSQGGWVKKK